MQAKKRYILFVVICSSLVLCYLGAFRLQQHGSQGFTKPLKSRSYADSGDLQLYPDEDLVVSPSQRRAERRVARKSGNCALYTCFDLTRCQKDFKVYVYPVEEPISYTYRKILNVIRNSGYYTSDPSRACLFVLGIDTLDRDSLSTDFIPDLQSKLDHSKHWNNGQNHVIFNLYSGTWPDYVENLGFDIDEAILAKASMSTANLRPNFDISLPLFSNNHPERDGERRYVGAGYLSTSKNYLLVFKGKRYLYGIGSETRNSLYHLHNGKDIILLTTCKHGKKWKEMKDSRCEVDNHEYDGFDYQVLLSNSTFCLIPRGRRLGSFRFLESLQAGCVPVLLSNGWELPFADVLDWSRAAVLADERLLLQVPDLIRSIPPTKVHSYRQQTQLLFNKYFSSVEKIVITTFEIIQERIRIPSQRSYYVWNSHSN